VTLPKHLQTPPQVPDFSPLAAYPWVEETLEEVSLIHNTPLSLLLGRGGIRDAEVALGRKVAYWVLKRRGVGLEAIARLFNRHWYTIVRDLRSLERLLTGPRPPAWAVDIYPLAGTTIEDLLRWATWAQTEADQAAILAYCRGTLQGRRGPPVPLQLQGLRLLATKPGLRKRVMWAFQSMVGTDHTWSVKWQARRLGWPYVEDQNKEAS
jgi:hypothetical protein